MSTSESSFCVYISDIVRILSVVFDYWRYWWLRTIWVIVSTTQIRYQVCYSHEDDSVKWRLGDIFRFDLLVVALLSIEMSRTFFLIDVRLWSFIVARWWRMNENLNLPSIQSSNILFLDLWKKLFCFCKRFFLASLRQFMNGTQNTE